MRCIKWASLCAAAGLWTGVFLGCGTAGPEQGTPAPAEPRAAAEATGKDVAAAVPAATTVTPEEVADGWIALFDGETLFGWQPASKANWRVEDGAITVDSGEAGLLCTTAEFGDHVLKLEFRSDADTNSGIFLHTPLKPDDPGRDCYELNIAGADNPFPTGSLVQRAKADRSVEAGDWQEFEVTLQAGAVAVKLNGQPLVAYADPQPLQRGRLGLQLNKGKVQFRNIRLKPLGLASLFNGKDLSGWKTYPDQPSRFSVTEEGWLHVENGRGQLESAESYGDFVLQLACRTNAPQLNSGIFFRCVPGSFMDGYESQIHNGCKNGDRTQPVDFGTGGIFRRQPARRVAADDGQWFSKTLVVHGPHVAVWVNGYQVTDWTDERPSHDNPRNGLRLQPGTLMIQGHDPTTDIHFRNLHITELAPRAAPPASPPAK